MITEDYVSFEVAKLLKKKGFNEITQGYINTDGEVYMLPFQQGVYELGKNQYLYPTLQMAMKWLREDKKRIINAWFDGYDYQSEVGKPEDEIFTLIGDEFKTYEEAVEAAIKYCLKDLV